MERFTVKMLLKSAYGDVELAITLANKVSAFYFCHENETAKSRYESLIECIAELERMK